MAIRGRFAIVTASLLGAVHCTVTSSDDSSALAVEVLAESVAAPSSVTTDRGLVVTVTRALVAIETIAIVPCEEVASAGEPSLLESLGLIGLAHAHSAVEPTRTGVPAVLPLVSSDGERIDVGPLAPPPGRYCAARIAFGPADADAEGMPDDGAAIGRTLIVEGTFAADGEPPAPFRLHSSESVAVDVPIDLTLGEDGRQTASLRVVVDGSRLLDGVDLATVDGEEGGDAALTSLAHAVVAELE